MSLRPRDLARSIWRSSGLRLVHGGGGGGGGGEGGLGGELGAVSSIQDVMEMVILEEIGTSIS